MRISFAFLTSLPTCPIRVYGVQACNRHVPSITRLISPFAPGARKSLRRCGRIRS